MLIRGLYRCLIGLGGSIIKVFNDVNLQLRFTSHQKAKLNCLKEFKIASSRVDRPIC